MSRDGRLMDVLAACGALLAGGAVGLSAYASHAAMPGARERLYLAAAFAFGHGAMIALLAPVARSRLPRLAALALFIGTLVFAGSLVGAALADWPTRLAPAGGLTIMAGWLMLALDRLRD